MSPARPPSTEVWFRVRIDREPWFAAALALVLLASCDAGRPREFQVRGTGIIVNSEAAFTKRADFPARLETTLDAALEYWGGTWSDLAGQTIVFDGHDHVECEGTSRAVGCYQGGEVRVSTRDNGVTSHCVEETVLVHEIGHAVIGDPNHLDPRWMDFTSVMRQLEGRPGFDGAGDAPCRISLGVWRHPASAQGG
jgi:hypothetical protein